MDDSLVIEKEVRPERGARRSELDWLWERGGTAFLTRKSETERAARTGCGEIGLLGYQQTRRETDIEKLVQCDSDQWVSSESGGYVHRAWVGCVAAGPGWWRGAELEHTAVSTRPSCRGHSRSSPQPVDCFTAANRPWIAFTFSDSRGHVPLGNCCVHLMTLVTTEERQGLHKSICVYVYDQEGTTA